MPDNNTLTLSDKLILTTLTLLIPYQEERPISLTHIANISGVSPRTVTNSLNRLRVLGIVSTSRPYSGVPYTYALDRDKMPQLDEDSIIALLYHQC